MVDYFRMVRRHIAEHLLQALADTPVVLVNGARQTGKSTLVQSAELIEQGRQYLTFDDPGVLGAAKRRVHQTEPCLPVRFPLLYRWLNHPGHPR